MTSRTRSTDTRRDEEVTSNKVFVRSTTGSASRAVLVVGVGGAVVPMIISDKGRRATTAVTNIFGTILPVSTSVSSASFVALLFVNVVIRIPTTGIIYKGTPTTRTANSNLTNKVTTAITTGRGHDVANTGNA